MTALGAISLAVGCAAVGEDLARRQISNWTSGAALAAGIGFHVISQGWRGGLWAVTGALLGFAVFLAFYLLNGLGGGDVKLMAGFGSLLGPGAIFWAAWMAAVLGAVMAVAYAAGGAFCVRHSRRAGRPPRKQAETIPYAPAIVAGVWLAELALG